LDVNGVVRKRLGCRKASFASPEETMERSGGMMIGGVTPFGLPCDLPAWIDALVMESMQVIVGGGSRDRKVLCAPQAIAVVPGAEVVELLAQADS
jgi:prolyl-tRNA editing enzyme YbaK/EbsC (Cys-tRNA(Pro) deacylase)